MGVVAIVGRPNVGKSTLFNRLIGERKAVVDDFPGVTRDRNYAQCTWNGRTFTLVDTGGYVPNSDEIIADLVSRQVELAFGEADLLLFVVDAVTGPTDYDAIMARKIRDSGAPYRLIVNKVDKDENEADGAAFYGLALGDPLCVSAINGRQSGDLLDEILTCLPTEEGDSQEELPPRIAVLGRPNMGKSTFVNRLIGRDRVVVSEIPGTTRDAIDLSMERNGRPFVLVDTAGLRRRTRVKEQVDFYSSLRTVESLERSDVAIVLVDAVEGCTVQDIKISERAIALGKGLILGINKWDLIEKDGHTADKIVQQIRSRFVHFENYPIVFLSALTGQRAWRVIDLALDVALKRRHRISTGDLNDFLTHLNSTTAPPTKNGRVFRMSFCVMPRSAPPTILFFTGRPKDVPVHYRRFLERRLRQAFDFLGTPIRILFKKK
jgi:GTP-binding protein